MKAKKVMALMLAAIMLVCTSVAATIAYLTDTASVKNTMTVGKIGLSLDEAKVDEYGVPQKYVKEEGKKLEWVDVADVEQATRVPNADDAELTGINGNGYKLIPGHTYVKDPTVTVDEDSEKSYIRMLVKVEKLDELKRVFANKKYGEEKLPYIVNDVLLLQYFVNGWDDTLWLYEGFDAANATYEFRYKDIVETVDKAALKLAPLFDSITFPSDVTGTELNTLTGLEINVTAHAIQADGFADADAAWLAFGK